MVQAPALLAEGASVIRFVARFELYVDDFGELDRATDDLMDALVLDDSILEPDITLSLTERQMAVLMLIASNDPMEASSVGVKALATAMKAAGQGDLGKTRVWMHDSLLQDRVQYELVPA